MPPGPPLPPPEGAPGKTNRGVLIALGVLAALVAVGGLVYLLTDDDDSEDETELTGRDADSTSTTSAPESAPTTDPSSSTTTSPATTVPTTEPPVTTPPDDPGDPGGPGDLSAAGPEETVELFFTAVVVDRDCETVLAMVSSNSIDWFGEDRAEQLATCEDTITEGTEGTTLESTSLVSETATEAVVETVVIEDGEPSTDPITLVREGDQWKVDISA